MTRLGLGGTFVRRAKTLTRFHMHMHRLDVMKASTFVKMFGEMDAFRDEEVVEHLMWLGAADHRGRLGHENADFGQLFHVMNLAAAANSVKFDDLGVAPPPATKVERVKELFFKARTRAVAAWMK
jgi:tRNA nucleotidyltransferase (CCA-adding enzyme)